MNHADLEQLAADHGFDLIINNHVPKGQALIIDPRALRPSRIPLPERFTRPAIVIAGLDA